MVRLVLDSACPMRDRLIPGAGAGAKDGRMAAEA